MFIESLLKAIFSKREINEENVIENDEENDKPFIENK